MLARHSPSDLAIRTTRWWFFTILSAIALACVSCSNAAQQTSSSQGRTVQSPPITKSGQMPLTDSVPPQGNMTPTAPVSTPQSVQVTTTPIVRPPSPTPTTPRSYQAEAPQNTWGSGTYAFGHNW